MIYTTCLMCYACFSFNQSRQFCRALIAGLTGLCIFITVSDSALAVIYWWLTTLRVIIITCKIPPFIKMRTRSLLPSLFSGACTWWRSIFGRHFGINTDLRPRLQMVQHQIKWRVPKISRETNRSLETCGWWLHWALPYSLGVLEYGTWIIITVLQFGVGGES